MRAQRHCATTAKHLPPFPPVLSVAVIAIVWASALWQWRRFGRQILSFGRVVLLVGFTCFLGGYLLPAGTAAREWTSNLGSLLMVAMIGISIVGSRR